MTNQDREHEQKDKVLYFRTFNDTFSLCVFFFFDQEILYFHSALGSTNYIAAVTTVTGERIKLWLIHHLLPTEFQEVKD